MAPKNPRMNNVDAASAKSAVATEAVPATVPTTVNAKSAAATSVPTAGGEAVVAVFNPEIAQAEIARLKAELAKKDAVVAAVKSKAAAKDAAVARAKAEIQQITAAKDRALDDAYAAKEQLTVTHATNEDLQKQLKDAGVRIKSLISMRDRARVAHDAERDGWISRFFRLESELLEARTALPQARMAMPRQQGALPGNNDLAWYDPGQFVQRFRPGWTQKQACAFVRSRVAQLGITWLNFDQHARAGWGKQGDPQKSRWKARQQALVRDLLPVLSH